MNKILKIDLNNNGLSRSFTGILLLLFLLTGLHTKLVSQSLPYSNSHFITVDELKLHYRLWNVEQENIRGNVFMVHGFGGSTFSWEQVADSLQQLGYRAVAVDVPPFGYSDRAPRQNQSVTYRAALFNAFLSQQFPGEKWHLAGHSMGGAIVQGMAILYPENFVSVNFVGAALFSSINEGSSHIPFFLRIPGVSAFLGNLAEEWFITSERVEGFLVSAYGQQPTHQQLNAYLKPLSIPGTATAILNAVRFSNEIHELQASDLEIPAIAIWGAEDSWVPVDSRRKMIAQMENLKLVFIDDAGHNPTETHFSQFMVIYLDFLNDF